MNYTKEFEEFCEVRFPDAFKALQLAHSNRPSGLSYSEGNRYGVEHFWLSAFVRLVKEEMEDIKHEYDNPRCDILGEAFERVCQRFGLEER